MYDNKGIIKQYNLPLIPRIGEKIVINFDHDNRARFYIIKDIFWDLDSTRVVLDVQYIEYEEDIVEPPF